MFQFAKKLSTKNLPWRGIARYLEGHAKVGRKKTRCFFCGYGPCGEPFNDKWRLAGPCLGKTCHPLMKEQWQSSDKYTAKLRIKLMMPTRESISKLIENRGFNSLRKVLEKKSAFQFSPMMDQVNRTRELNGLPRIDETTSVEDIAPQEADERVFVPESQPQAGCSSRYIDAMRYKTFIDAVPTFNGNLNFIVHTSHQDFEKRFSALGKNDVLPIFLVDNDAKLRGQTSEFSPRILRRDFTSCINHLFESNCMVARNLPFVITMRLLYLTFSVDSSGSQRIL